MSHRYPKHGWWATTSSATRSLTALQATRAWSCAQAHRPITCPSAYRSWPATGTTSSPCALHARSSGRWAAGVLLAWSGEVSLLTLGRDAEARRTGRGRRPRRALRRPDELRRPQRCPAAVSALGLAQHARPRAAAEATSRGA